MRITFVLGHAGHSGGVRVVAIYAERLRRRGHEVTIVSAPRPARRLGQMARDLRQGRWPWRRAAGSPYLDGVPVEHRVLDRPRPVTDADLPDADVVIATWWETAFAVARLSPSKGRKIYFVQHHEVHEHLPSHLSAGSYHLPLKKITISNWLVDTMAELYDDRDVDLVPNSVDLAQFDAPLRGKQRRPTVGFLYSTAPFKALPVTFQAVEAIRAKLPDLRILAFGAAPPARTLPLPANTEYVRQPSQAAIKDIYANCDVWLCGSRAEGFHLPPLEAMACRTPVVSTKVGGAVETVVDGQNGFLVEVGDWSALAARALDVLRLDDDRWRGFSERARARAEAYSWDDATDLFEAALRRHCDAALAADRPRDRVRG